MKQNISFSKSTYNEKNPELYTQVNVQLKLDILVTHLFLWSTFITFTGAVRVIHQCGIINKLPPVSHSQFLISLMASMSKIPKDGSNMGTHTHNTSTSPALAVLSLDFTLTILYPQ